MISTDRKSLRRGGVYIAVLGTSLLVALLGLSALMLQRIQNRMLVASADIRQAQLNAATAVELVLLTMKRDTNWRTLQSSGTWFSNRATARGTCTAIVTDPVDDDLADSPDDPIRIIGIGYSGSAQQRVEHLIDPKKQPLSCLRSAIAAGGSINLSWDTLRTGGLITADDINVSSSQIYGAVEAVSISGSTYNGTTTQIASADRPQMPDWSTAFNYYRTNGTEIPLASLPSRPTSNFARNWSIENGTTDWTGSPPGFTVTAEVSQTNNWSRSGSYSLRIKDRTHWTAGAAQRIEHFVKPGQQYDLSAWVRVSGLLGTRTFRIWLYTKGTGDSTASSVFTPSASVTVILGINLPVANVAGRVTVPAWTGDLEYAFIKISDDSTSGSSEEFFLDDLVMTEAASGKYIYRQVLAPTRNPFGSSTDPQGIYWINCAGTRVNIERSRIHGTLLLINPGAGSRIDHGPIHWSPAVPGYPALLVQNGDFMIRSTLQALKEKEQAVNYNPAEAAHDEFGADNDTNDIYRSAIHGLVAVEDDVTFANRSLIRGQLLTGDDLQDSSGELEVEFLPDSLLTPPPGFLAPYLYVRRPGSVRQVVLP